MKKKTLSMSQFMKKSTDLFNEIVSCMPSSVPSVRQEVVDQLFNIVHNTCKKTSKLAEASKRNATKVKNKETNLILKPNLHVARLNCLRKPRSKAEVQLHYKCKKNDPTDLDWKRHNVCVQCSTTVNAEDSRRCSLCDCAVHLTHMSPHLLAQQYHFNEAAKETGEMPETVYYACARCESIRRKISIDSLALE